MVASGERPVWWFSTRLLPGSNSTNLCKTGGLDKTLWRVRAVVLWGGKNLMFSTFNSPVKAPLVRSGLLRCPPPELLSCDVQFKQIEVGSLGAISPAADPFFPVKTHLAVNKDFARSL